jgi:hypothetical protein
MVRTVPKMERQSRCFNRRLLQQYRHEADISRQARDVRFERWSIVA